MSFRLRGAVSSKFFGAPKLRWTSLDEFNPQSEFFANNEQGIWLDLSDMTTAKANWRRNLLGYTQELNNSYWATANATITADFAIDPSGMMVADRIVETVANGEHRVQNNVTLAFVSGVTYTVSGLFKAGEVTSVRFGFDEPVKLPGRVFFNLSNGTIAFTEYGSGTITSIGDGWYRCTVTGTCNTGYSGRIEVNLVQPSTTVIYAGSTSNGLLVSSLQLEVGNAATDYQRISDFSTEFKSAFSSHSLYQDSSGVTPSTTAGDPVGLVLDRSRGGLVTASQKAVTYNDVGAFGSHNNMTLVGTTLSATSPPQNGYSARISVTPYRFYHVEIPFPMTASGGSWDIWVSWSANGTTYSGSVVTGISLTTSSFMFSAPATAIACEVTVRRASASSGGATDTCGPFRGFIIREVLGNHAFQTTSAARPLMARVPISGRRNLIAYSEQFDNAVWPVSAGANTILPNEEPAPDGSLTADLMVFTGVGYPGRLQIIPTALVAGVTYTFSVYIKRISGSNSGRIEINGGGGSIIAVVTNFTGTAEWQRIVVTGTAVSSGTASVYVYPEYAASSTGEYLIYGAQLEIGSSPTNYQKVNSTYDVTETGYNDSWHLVFDGSDDSLITNPIDFSTATIGTRKNFLINTEDFSQNWTLPFVTVTMNAIAAPDGSLTADKIVETVDNDQHFVYQNYAPSNGQVCTLSVYAKAAERTWISLQGGGSGGIWFNLSNGTIGTNSGGGFTGTIESAGNGWYRCSISGTWTSQTNYILVRPSDGGYSYTGDGTSGLYLWGAQLEFGSTMTSYQRVGTERMTIFAGVRKLNDAADGLIAELSANSNNNAGSFYIAAPEVTASPPLSYSSLSRGSAVASANQRANITSAAAPETAVITATHDISADLSTMRRNGVAGASATGDKGSGDFGNYQLFIGRRNQASVQLNGHIYQLIILGRSCTVTKISEAERYIGKLIGVTL